MTSLRFGLAALLLVPALARADGPPPDKKEPTKDAADNPFAKLKFEEGPIVGKLEDVATVKVPEGAAFISGRAESAKFIEATKNLVSHQEVGIMIGTGQGDGWWLDFEFDPVGYIKDDDKADLDADKLMESMKEGTEQGNEERRKRGWDDLHVLGWHTTPRYNPTTHNLEWATRLQGGKGGEDVNYNVRLLGRRGVMSVTLISPPQQLDTALVKLQSILTGFGYVPEQTYAAYKPGDKVATYGLAALVAGGTLAVAAKTGLLAKFWKLIVAGFAAIAAAFRKLFGGKKREEQPPMGPPPMAPPPPPGV